VPKSPRPTHPTTIGDDRRRPINSARTTHPDDGDYPERGWPAPGRRLQPGSRNPRQLFWVASLRGRTLRQLKRDDIAVIIQRVARSRSGMFKLMRLLWSLRPIFGPSWRGFKRPGVVLFGGAMAEPDWRHAQQDVKLCDMMLVVGTSGLIYPAALLPGTARQHGARVISIDPQESGPSHVWLRGRAGDLLPELVRSAFP
jgi:Sir2 family